MLCIHHCIYTLFFLSFSQFLPWFGYIRNVCPNYSFIIVNHHHHQRQEPQFFISVRPDFRRISAGWGVEMKRVYPHLIRKRKGWGADKIRGWGAEWGYTNVGPRLLQNPSNNRQAFGLRGNVRGENKSGRCGTMSEVWQGPCVCKSGLNRASKNLTRYSRYI